VASIDNQAIKALIFLLVMTATRPMQTNGAILYMYMQFGNNLMPPGEYAAPLMAHATAADAVSVGDQANANDMTAASPIRWKGINICPIPVHPKAHQ